KLKLILAQVSANDPLYKTDSDVHAATGRPDPSRPAFVVTDPTAIQMINEEVGALKLLHGACSSRERKSFARLLCKEISESNASVVVVALLHIGGFNEIIDILLNKDLLGNVRVRNSIWFALRPVLTLESHRFSDDDLQRLEDVRQQDVASIKKHVDSIIIEAPYNV